MGVYIGIYITSKVDTLPNNENGFSYEENNQFFHCKEAWDGPKLNCIPKIYFGLLESLFGNLSDWDEHRIITADELKTITKGMIVNWDDFSTPAVYKDEEFQKMVDNDETWKCTPITMINNLRGIFATASSTDEVSIDLV